VPDDLRGHSREAFALHNSASCESPHSPERCRVHPFATFVEFNVRDRKFVASPACIVRKGAMEQMAAEYTPVLRDPLRDDRALSGSSNSRSVLS
jgi:hypothetical protein